MLLVQIQKVLLNNQYTVIGFNRTFAGGDDTCFEVLFAGPAGRIPDKYSNRRVYKIYPDKNGSQIVELEG